MAKFPEHIAIEKVHPEAVLDWYENFGDRTLIVESKQVVEVAKILRDQFGYKMLLDLTAVDYLPRRPRFEVVYHYLNLQTNTRIRIKTQLEESHTHLPTLSGMYPIADWYEREVWDLFGIKFDGHPNLKRIMLYEGFEGHPLRKDYPKTKRQPLLGPQN
jgi:NADH-quinone oxidoreductase subunit C